MYEREALIYENPLEKEADIKNFVLEGEAAVSFPMKKLRMENKKNPEEGQSSNFVLWCDQEFPDHIEISWDFKPIREPGLCVFFFAATGERGEDVLSSSLKKRTGPYDQYHSSDIHALHISYFRRRYESEREFHLCNLRKSHGFHLVAQGADPIPSVNDIQGSYRIKVIKSGSKVLFYVNDLCLFQWEDDGERYGACLKGGKIGFRQMAPLMAEYSNLKVYTLK